MRELHGDEENEKIMKQWANTFLPSIGNTYLIKGNCLVNLYAALKHEEKDKSNVKNIIKLIDFNNIILKNYYLKYCDKCQEFTNIETNCALFFTCMC